MPGAGTMRSKQKRAGSLGQSARLYTLKLGKKICAEKIPGARGFGKHNAAIGSVLSLGNVKQTRKAGGNNACMSNTHLAAPPAAALAAATAANAQLAAGNTFYQASAEAAKVKADVQATALAETIRIEQALAEADGMSQVLRIVQDRSAWKEATASVEATLATLATIILAVQAADVAARSNLTNQYTAAQEANDTYDQAIAAASAGLAAAGVV
jgi:hypothetical protein